ncbi:hypothetical protein ECANGB1_2662 [Enterospora canceri]|uniref:Secreted protein n=1 Tax=Enterospora canceri TaxID=1081671 RepID=A0A1Y1S5S2_9MICR|nr:hypothetical protein ECANGB1_2662 [Enterospora canceri]
MQVQFSDILLFLVQFHVVASLLQLLLVELEPDVVEDSSVYARLQCLCHRLVAFPEQILNSANLTAIWCHVAEVVAYRIVYEYAESRLILPVLPILHVHNCSSEVDMRVVHEEVHHKRAQILFDAG